MEKLIWVIPIILVLILSGCIKKEVDKEPNTKGEYFDLEGSLLGNCMSESVNYTMFTKFYDLDGKYIGECWVYTGPGGSGYKGGCSNEIVGVKFEDSQNLINRYDCIQKS